MFVKTFRALSLFVAMFLSPVVFGGLPDNTIEGVITLPNGELAPAGGVTIDLNALDQNFNEFPFFAQVTIPEGAGSTPYSYSIPSNANSSWVMEFSCTTPGGCDDYVTTLYYADSGPVLNQFSATQLAGGQNHTGINVTLESAYTVEGTVSLPNSDVAPFDGIFFGIAAEDASGAVFDSVNSNVEILSGESEIDYVLKVPINLATDVRIRYSCFSDGCEVYLSDGYYSSTGTVFDADSASSLPAGSNYSDIDLVFLESSRVSGVVSLPDGAVAPAGGFDLFVSASGANGTSGFFSADGFIQIAAGESEIPYTIGIPDDATSQWRISYFCSFGCDGFLSSGYYSSAGTTEDFEGFTPVFGGADSTDIDLELLPVNTISGTVSLPVGRVAPAGGTEVRVTANGLMDFQSVFVQIPEGSSQMEYSLGVSTDSSEQRRISVNCISGCAGLLGFAYYNSAGTVEEFSDAEILQGGVDHPGINIEIPEGIIISGSVSLPAALTAPAGGISIEVSALEDREFGLTSSVTDIISILEGENSTNYQLTVSGNSLKSWGVRYRCSPECPGFAGFGYYSDAGMVAVSTQASVLPGGSDIPNINLELIESSEFSGMVSLPGDDLAPAGGTSVRLAVIPDIGNSFEDEFDVELVIPEGQSEVSYSILVAQDDSVDWVISFSCNSGCDPYYERGFYSDSGTLFDFSQATRLSGGSDLAELDIEIANANFITGNLSLPGGAVAPVGGIDVDVFARILPSDFSGFESIFLTIPEGSSSETYSLKIRPVADESWTVSYNCFSDNCAGFTEEGYYGEFGTVPTASGALELLSGSDSADIDLELLPAVSISGTLSLPNGVILNGNDVFIEIYAYDRNLTDSNGQFESIGRSLFSLSGDISEFDYSIDVFDDPNADIFIGVSCFFASSSATNACDPIIQETFIGESGSGYNEASVTGLTGGTDITGVDGVLIEADVIRGEVSLPNGPQPSGLTEITVLVEQSAEPFDFSTQTSPRILEGEESVNYTIKVPKGLPENNWILRAECDSNCGDYEFQSYYRPPGSTSIREQATPLANTQGYTGINIPLVVETPLSTFMCNALVDDFSGTALDLSIWEPGYSGILAGGLVEIEQSLISQAERSTFGFGRRFNLNLLSFPDQISADVELKSVDLTDSGTGAAFASVRGSFYYTLDDAALYDDNLGEVFASVEIGDRGDGLEAWYSIYESLDSTFDTTNEILEETLIPPGTITLDTVYNMTLSFNPSTREFTFDIDGTSATVVGPEAGTAVVPTIGLFRGFTAGVVPEENTDTDPMSVRATFDNIFIDADVSDAVDPVLYDDFSGSTLDPAKWEQVLNARTIAGGKMLTAIESLTDDTRSIFTLLFSDEYQNAMCIQADMEIQDTSVVPPETRIRNRINGYFYNDSLDGAAGYNGFEGTVYAQIALEQTESGQIRATAYAERADDANYNDSTQMVFHEFTAEVAFDEEYTAAIQLDESNRRLLFQFADEVFSLPIVTSIYATNPEENFTGFTTRTQSGPGEISATIDNVYATPTTLVPVSDSGSGDFCFPIVGAIGTAVICL